MDTNHERRTMMHDTTTAALVAIPASTSLSLSSIVLGVVVIVGIVLL